MNRGRALSQLSACLRGRIPRNADWEGILTLANEALITTELYPLLMDNPETRGRLPDDVRTFLTEVHARNLARNRSLFGTLKDALAALNAVGIEPVLLKGCSMWAAGKDAVEKPTGERMLSDLDLLVRPSERPQALAALEGVEFEVFEDHAGEDDHVVAILGRTSDAGTIDLHHRAPGPVGIQAVGRLHEQCRRVSIAGLHARVPPPELQILIASVHDQILDGDFWMGGFHIRHLVDIAKLSRNAEGVDWHMVIGSCPTSLLRDVVETQLLAARHIAGANVPDGIGARLWIGAQYARLRLQSVLPSVNVPLRWVGRAIRWRDFSSRSRVPASLT